MATHRATIMDVARLAGVSKGAVSFALNGRPGVAAETRERILAAARELGWTPSLRGRALSVSRSLAVGLVIARSPETLGADPFFASLITGIETVLSERGYALMLQLVRDEKSEHESYRRLAASGRVDGVFLTDMRVGDVRPQLLTDLGLPTVVIGHTQGPEPWSSVYIDDQPGIAAAVEHLVALGHRRIDHVAGPAEFVHGLSRRAAWASAVRHAGLAPGICITSDFSAQGGADATNRLLDLADPPTAIVFANDLMAIAGMSTAIGRGVDIPGQLSITGFDDSPLAAYVHPALTTSRTDVVGWGRASATRLLAIVGGEGGAEIDLPGPEFVVRASTAPPRHPGTGAPSNGSVRPPRPIRRLVKDTVTQPPHDHAVRPSEHVAKPWGHEEIFALVEGSYIGKLLHIRAGQSLSLQYHHSKDETIALISGQVELDLGPDAETLRAVTLSPGDSVHVTPGMLHRLRAVQDSVLVEASTAAPGWREDIVRLEDRYGRLGTTAP